MFTCRCRFALLVALNGHLSRCRIRSRFPSQVISSLRWCHPPRPGTESRRTLWHPYYTMVGSLVSLYWPKKFTWRFGAFLAACRWCNCKSPTSKAFSVCKNNTANGRLDLVFSRLLVIHITRLRWIAVQFLFRSLFRHSKKSLQNIDTNFMISNTVNSNKSM